MKTSGTLYIVSTPIGNLEDLTLRALRILKEVDLIAAEDTRHTRKLLSHYDIHTPATSYFDQNETQKSSYLVRQLLQGKSVALVSDAGTPGISDPGYAVIVAAIEQDIPIVPVPGPCAMVTALTVSGLPIDKFVFIGFLTNKRRARIKQLKELQQETKTLVCYVSPHHFLKVLEDIRDVLGDRNIVVTRELTKTFEEIVRGSATMVLQEFHQRPSIKGELTVVIAGADRKTTEVVDTETIVAHLTDRMAKQGLSRKDAVKMVAQELGIPKNRVYQESLNILKEEISA